MINKELQEYIEKNIFPQLQNDNLMEGLDQVNYVIKRSLKFANTIPDINYDMVYVIAVYRDIANYVTKDEHAKNSSEVLLADNNLKRFFTQEQLKIMAEAVEDHKAKLEYEPRSIYGKIVASAGRNDSVEKTLKRSYKYGKKKNPDASDEELFANAFNVLTAKFGPNGYAKMYFPDEEYEKFIKDLRVLLADKDKFISTQRAYIEKLRENGEL